MSWDPPSSRVQQRGDVHFLMPESNEEEIAYESGSEPLVTRIPGLDIVGSPEPDFEMPPTAEEIEERRRSEASAPVEVGGYMLPHPMRPMSFGAAFQRFSESMSGGADIEDAIVEAFPAAPSEIEPHERDLRHLAAPLGVAHNIPILGDYISEGRAYLQSQEPEGATDEERDRIYDEELAQIRTEHELAREQAPGSYMLGQAAASAPLLLAPLAAPTIAGAMGLGALESLVLGASRRAGDDALASGDERIAAALDPESAATDAALGAAVPGVLGGVGAAVRGGANMLRRGDRSRNAAANIESGTALEEALEGETYRRMRNVGVSDGARPLTSRSLDTDDAELPVDIARGPLSRADQTARNRNFVQTAEAVMPRGFRRRDWHNVDSVADEAAEAIDAAPTLPRPVREEVQPLPEGAQELRREPGVLGLASEMVRPTQLDEPGVAQLRRNIEAYRDQITPVLEDIGQDVDNVFAQSVMSGRRANLARSGERDVPQFEGIDILGLRNDIANLRANTLRGEAGSAHSVMSQALNLIDEFLEPRHRFQRFQGGVPEPEATGAWGLVNRLRQLIGEGDLRNNNRAVYNRLYGLFGDTQREAARNVGRLDEFNELYERLADLHRMEDVATSRAGSLQTAAQSAATESFPFSRLLGRSAQMLQTAGTRGGRLVRPIQDRMRIRGAMPNGRRHRILQAVANNELPSHVARIVDPLLDIASGAGQGLVDAATNPEMQRLRALYFSLTRQYPALRQILHEDDESLSDERLEQLYQEAFSTEADAAGAADYEYTEDGLRGDVEAAAQGQQLSDEELQQLYESVFGAQGQPR
jgi:hypothetical protein